jgi:hypothetical protein
MSARRLNKSTPQGESDESGGIAELPFWARGPVETRRQRRDRIHADTREALRERLNQLRAQSGQNAAIAAQTAALADWIAQDARKVEYLGTLWVGKRGLPTQQLRNLVGRFTATCRDHMRQQLQQQSEQLDSHFCIWVVFERSEQRNEQEQRLHAHLLYCMSEEALPHFRAWRGQRARHANRLWREIVLEQSVWARCTPTASIKSCRHDKRGFAGALLYVLKEVHGTGVTELEPAAALEPESMLLEPDLPKTCKSSQKRRLRRSSYASAADMREFRSVRVGGSSNDEFLEASRRRRNCLLDVPEHWRPNLPNTSTRHPLRHDQSLCDEGADVSTSAG